MDTIWQNFRLLPNCIGFCQKVYEICNLWCLYGVKIEILFVCNGNTEGIGYLAVLEGENVANHGVGSSREGFTMSEET